MIIYIGGGGGQGHNEYCILIWADLKDKKTSE
jgi:hypothetical protein